MDYIGSAKGQNVKAKTHLWPILSQNWVQVVIFYFF